MIAFQDLGRLHRSVGAELNAALAAVVSDSAFVGGRHVHEFEEAFAEAHGLAGAVACGSGTDALVLALVAAGVRPGDKVVVPSMTFIATAEAVVHAGGMPVIADVDQQTLLLTRESVATVMTEGVRAIIPVHLYGNVTPSDLLREWRASGLLVIEDAAQAHLGRFHSDRVGSLTDATCFSFYPGKNLGAFGDGGAVASQNMQLLDEVRLLRDHGRKGKYVHEKIGWCSRLDGIQAAVLKVKLGHLEEWTAARRELADRYARNLSSGAAALVPWHPGAVHHLLVVRVAERQRDALQAGLAAVGISTGVHYPMPLSEQPAMKAWTAPTPVSETAAREVLTLPMDPLMSAYEVDQVCEMLQAKSAELSRTL